MLVTEDEIAMLRDFVCQLNYMEDGVVIVEGRRDAAALQGLGFSGNILQFHKFGGPANFADSVAQYKNVVMLLDGDRKGRTLTRKVIRLLARRTKIDTSFRKRLRTITKGKVTFTEQLRCYEQYFG